MVLHAEHIAYVVHNLGPDQTPGPGFRAFMIIQTTQCDDVKVLSIFVRANFWRSQHVELTFPHLTG